MKRPGLALLLLPLFACGDDQRPTVGDTPPPPATTDATGLAPSTDEGTTASQSCACAPDQFCGAYYVPGDPPPEPEAFVCQDECIADDAPGYWCRDDASCCVGTCRPDGLCASASADAGTDTTTDAGTTTDASSGGSSSGGSSSGGSSSGGSSSGGSSSGGSSSGGSSTTAG